MIMLPGLRSVLAIRLSNTRIMSTCCWNHSGSGGSMSLRRRSASVVVSLDPELYRTDLLDLSS